MRLRAKPHSPASRLRLAVDALPRRTKEAMLRGIESNPIVVGAYVDHRTGGICPMLAAHRNGGRASVASFARAWDRYTGARRPRLATKRELRALRAMLTDSLAREELGLDTSLAAAAAEIRAARERLAAERPPAPRQPGRAPAGPRRARFATGERHRGAELRRRPRWAWLRPARRYDEFRDLLAAAEEQLAEQRAGELLSPGTAASQR